MKKSAIVVNLLRAALVVLAYKEVAHPKAGMIPPGTGRFTAQYAKSCLHIGRSWLRKTFSRLKHRIA
jgi:hypothetical protein